MISSVKRYHMFYLAFSVSKQDSTEVAECILSQRFTYYILFFFSLVSYSSSIACPVIYLSSLKILARGKMIKGRNLSVLQKGSTTPD